MIRLCVALLTLLVAGGCHRTSYSNLAPLSLKSQGESSTVSRVPQPRWRHFWLYGWAPGEMVIDAAATCGGASHISRIDTRKTFAQGLMLLFTTYYINVYSPYTGAVVCDNDRRL